jgi:hypothetical protein
VLAPHTTGNCGQNCGSSCSSSAGRHWMVLQAKVYPGTGVGVSYDGVFRCREPSWRRWL